MKRWNVLVRANDGEESVMVVRGATKEQAILNTEKYKGVSVIVSINERVRDRAFAAVRERQVERETQQKLIDGLSPKAKAEYYKKQMRV